MDTGEDLAFAYHLDDQVNGEYFRVVRAIGTVNGQLSVDLIAKVEGKEPAGWRLG